MLRLRRKHEHPQHRPQHHRPESGRTSPEQKLDYATGYTGFCQIGDYVDEQNPLAFVHAESEEDYNFAADELQRNIVTANEKPQINPAVAETVE